MNLGKWITTILILALSINVQAQKKKTAKYTGKILVYTKNGKGYVHENRAAASDALVKLGNENGLQVDVSEDANVFTDANLQQYKLVVFNNTNNDVFDTEAQKVAFMRFIQAGGGFVGIHSATGTERNWKWFKRLVGGTFVYHPPNQPFNQIIIDQSHPSTRHLPQVWPRKDECYYVKEMSPGIKVLAVHDLTTVKDDKDKPDFFGHTFPSVWTQEFDGGRQWYTALGHDAETYSDPDFVQHLWGGISWVIDGNKKLDYSKAHAKTSNDPLPY